MSALTTDWAHIKAEATTTNPAQSRRANSREEEFRSALDSYLTGYREHRVASNYGVRKINFTHVQRLAGWVGLPKTQSTNRR